MHKRTLAVVAVAAFAGGALQFGLPTGAAASGPTYASFNIKPLPIEQPGMLPVSGTVTMCVQPLDGSGHVVPGANVFLSIDSGLFTVPMGTPGGSATAEGTTLSGTPASFLVQASCNYANAETSGTLLDAVPITYTGPTSALTHGRDVIAAESDATSFDMSTGLCTGPGVCLTGTYVFSPVASYQFSNVPIAPTGSLTAGEPVTFSVTAFDNSTPTPQSVPGAFFDLSLTGSSDATATGVNTFTGFTKAIISNQPNRFGADNNGSVLITYNAANPLPTTGTDTITVQNLRNNPTVHTPTTYSYGGTVAFPRGPYTAVTPFRVCDTRPAGGGILTNQCNTASNPAGHGPITQGATRVVTIVGSGGVVSGATAVVLNVTAIDPSLGTFVSLSPDGAPASQRTSNLNPAAGTVIANLVEVALSPAGKIDVFNAAGTVNVALDIEGFVSSGSPGLFNSISPVRACDTRVGPGIASNQCNQSGADPILSTAPRTINVDGFGSPPIPTSGVSAVVFNLTAISPSKQTVLTAYAGGTTKPNASNVNLNAGATVPNRVIVPVTCAAGHCTVTIANGAGSVNVAVDLDGWFQASSGTQFTALPPARLCDTRFGNGSDQGCIKAKVAGGHVLNINVTGIDNLPASPVALVANITAVNATSPTFVTVYPGMTSTPSASDLNVLAGRTSTNLVVVEVGSDGTINLFNAAGNVDLIVDILGYYS